ncbi:MAG: PH domain-containing protein [Candidatus Krumholzibacteria bacterium]|nr:PH domain-containing protein [Candidatus Krumholzibacteria bacterium]MDH4337401.1 PH domain-containing protein [Candidatus Krumholzibacteria bacterium]MDH5270894.1 PH domain-containing protein [Candidatus Krumholzibacteria bacterium]
MTTPSRHRLHPLSPLFGIAAQLRGFILPAAVVFFAARSGPWDIWLLWAAIPLSLAAVYRYFTMRYSFADEEMIVTSGALFKNERHIRYARIQNIETVRNPFHRLFGVAEVRIETAGASEQEARLRVLSLDAVEELRRHVFDGKRRAGVEAGSGATEAADAHARAESRTLLRLRLRDIVAFGLIDNRGLIVVAAAWGLLWELDLLDFFDEQSSSLIRSLWNSMAGTGGGFESWTFAHFLRHSLILAGGLVALVVVVRILSVAWAVFRLWGFTLELIGGELRSSSGLFTRVHGTIPLQRIQLVTVDESPLQRRFGRVSVRVQTAGGEENKAATREWLAPILPRALADRLLGDVLPGLAPGEIDWQPVGAHARWRLWREWLWVTLVAALVASLIADALGIGVLLALTTYAWFAARGQARGYGYALGTEHLSFRTGWLWKHTSTARHEKVQVVSMHRSPFDRRWRMASLAADTAGGGAHRINIPYLNQDTARDLFDRLRETASRTRFRW